MDPDADSLGTPVDSEEEADQFEHLRGQHASNFNAGTAGSRPSDAMRVTWTDLAKGRNQDQSGTNGSGGGGVLSPRGFGSIKAANQNQQASFGGQGITPSHQAVDDKGLADFSLKEQQERLKNQYEGIDDDEDEDLSPEKRLKQQRSGEIFDAENEGELPTEYKAKFTRRATKLRQQILDTNEKSEIEKLASEMAEKPLLTGSQENLSVDLETEIAEGSEEEDLLFGNFKFRSFKKHKLMEEDYDIINIKDPEEPKKLEALQVYSEEKLVKEGVELMQVNQSQLIEQEKNNKVKEEQRIKNEKLQLKEEKQFIEKQQPLMSKELVERKTEIHDLLMRKQERSKLEFEMKQEVLQSRFKTSVNSLIKKVKKQRDLITTSYGPVVLNSKKIEKPIFDINKELDPEGHKQIRQLNVLQEKMPQTILVKMRTVRSLKDKISSGNYLMIVHYLDRIGGNRIMLNAQRTAEDYRHLSKQLRSFAIKKRQFLNQENRQIIQSSQDGKSQFVGAQATGQNFFKPADLNQQVETSAADEENQLEDSSQFVEKPIDLDKDVEIELDRTYTHYRRFNGRFSDNNLEIEDTLSLLINSELESTNCLQFQLVLLESDLVPRDYVVGWGIFPLLNSDF